ncbi:MAG: elongation factor Ts [Lentisphaeria bacterium]|nr:elongation factor Ts [Lentisphaeria bacterium]
MAAITASMVKELRDKTDAGMMECKKALQETDGNMDAAIEFLRKAGVAKAGKRAERQVKEGKIFIVAEGNAAVIVEVLSETDFVAKNEKFFEYVKAAAARILAATSGDGDITAKAQEIEAANLTQMIATIGENMQLRRAYRYETAGKVGSYLHLGGKIGVVVDVEGEVPADLDLNSICMHIAAFKPSYVCSCEVPAEAIAKEREIAAAQIQGKPANIVDKIVDGKINKWYSEICLVNQPWIHDDKTTLAKIAPKMTVKRFIRWEVGQEL